MTGFDKALVALLMGILQIIEAVWGWSFGISEEWIISLLAILTPILVWLVPNLPRSDIARRSGAIQ